MSSSAEVALLFKISELARRFGLRPSEVDADLHLIHVEENDAGVFQLAFERNFPRPGNEEKVNKMMAALGCSEGFV
jgi:hypothetical protein